MQLAMRRNSVHRLLLAAEAAAAATIMTQSDWPPMAVEVRIGLIVVLGFVALLLCFTVMRRWHVAEAGRVQSDTRWWRRVRGALASGAALMLLCSATMTLIRVGIVNNSIVTQEDDDERAQRLTLRAPLHPVSEVAVRLRNRHSVSGACYTFDPDPARSEATPVELAMFDGFRQAAFGRGQLVGIVCGPPSAYGIESRAGEKREFYVDSTGLVLSEPSLSLLTAGCVTGGAVFWVVLSTNLAWRARKARLLREPPNAVRDWEPDDDHVDA